MFERNPIARGSFVVIGFVLLIVAAAIGPLPGPGGIPVAVAGLTLILRYARWSKRIYVKLKRRWPKQGGWADWGLRRASAKRRAELKQNKN